MQRGQSSQSQFEGGQVQSHPVGAFATHGVGDCGAGELQFVLLPADCAGGDAPVLAVAHTLLPTVGPDRHYFQPVLAVVRDALQHVLVLFLSVYALVGQFGEDRVLFVLDHLH